MKPPLLKMEYLGVIEEIFNPKKKRGVDISRENG
jgi:hypothetical protein